MRLFTKVYTPIYKVMVTPKGGRLGIWYGSKVGHTYYVTPFIRQTTRGYVPVLKVVNFNEETMTATETAADLIIHFADAHILDQFIYRNEKALKYNQKAVA